LARSTTQRAARAADTLPSAPEPILDHISKRNFERLARHIHGNYGIKLPPGKMTMVEGRLRRRVRALGLSSINAYCEHVFDMDGLESEAVHMVNALTTNKTDFFREPKHFEFLMERVLPELSDRNCIKAWSAACSTGAEPYTLAMVMDRFLAGRSSADYSILATDVNTHVLEVARRGVYPEEVLEPVSGALWQRYVMVSKDRAAKLCRIVPALRSRVQFAPVNLMDSTYPFDRDMDIVMCRNVLIYFDRGTQESVLERLCSHLRPGGYLFLGHSESITGLRLPVAQVANTIFQRQ